MILPTLWFIFLASTGFQQKAASAPPSQPNFKISGTVINALSGAPVADAIVSIIPAKPPAVTQTVKSESGGRFYFEHVLPGKYQLSAHRKGISQQLFQEHDGFSTAIAVGDGLDSENIAFPLTPDASISGQISDQAGEPFRHAQVMLFRQGTAGGKQSTHIQSQQRSNDEGRYRFSHLMPGTYYVAVSGEPWFKQFVSQFINSSSRGLTSNFSGAETVYPHPPLDPALDIVYPITFFPNSTDSLSAEPFLLKPGDRAVADMTLSPVPDVHIRINLGTSEISQFPQIQASQPVFDGFQSGFTVQIAFVAPGVIEVSGLPSTPVNMRIQFRSGKDSPAVNQELQIAGSSEVFLASSPRAASASGLIQLEGAKQLPQQAHIQLQNSSTGVGYNAVSSLDGEFEFDSDRFPAGKYELTVSGVPGYSVRSVLATGAKVSGRTLTISGEQDVRLAIGLLRGVSQVEGVALRDGKPVVGAMIVLVPHDPENNLQLFRRDQSDSDGTFSLPSVSLGECTVIAIADGWNLEWSNPAVLAKYLPSGTKFKIEPDHKYKIEVQVQ